MISIDVLYFECVLTGITDALPSVVVRRRVMSSDLKKSPTCCALKQFIVPCPNHVLDVLIWKLSALQSFFNTASEWIQSGLFKMFLHDGVFCVGIAAARMNLFKDSLYNFASATKGFLLHYNIPVEFGSKNHSAQNLRFFEL